ncbi:MAG: hypothetical protein LBN20_05760 [Endomicrobium sp.]|jgi:hypothetical protein|nr:hypothetical protein [Endomicrobium sp.]
MNKEINNNFAYFSKNMPMFYKKYGHKFLAIKDKKVIGAYDSENDALKNTLQTEKLGSFLIQECFKNQQEAIYHFQGNVSFDFVQR